jgi:hypothetical protein
VRAASNPWTTKNGTVATDAATRYDWGDTSNRPGLSGAGAFCTGDNNDYAVGSPPVTTYVVRADTTPLDPTSGPTIAQGSCDGLQFPGFNETLSGNTLNSGGAGYDANVASVWRQWVPVCMFDPSSAPSVADYLLQIRTNIPLGASKAQMAGTGAPQGTGGSNRFAIRAAWVTGGSTFSLGTYSTPPTYSRNTGITIAGVGYMGLYANAAVGSTSPNFYMARVLPGGGSQTLRVRLFDIGDCGGCSGAPTLSFQQPDGTAWSSCKVKIGDNAGSFTTYSPCSFPDLGTNKWSTVDIAVPAGYSCNASDASDCWTKMSYGPTGSGASLNDTTTWSAQILGNPVRLVK